MRSRDFCYWLQGYFELIDEVVGPITLSKTQVECIRNHLSMVFVHEIDPSTETTPAMKTELNKIHGNKVMRC